MKQSITIDIDTDKLPSYTNEYLSTLFHVAQANPAEIDDHEAARLAEAIAHEIVRRWLKLIPGDMYNHQGSHVRCMGRTCEKFNVEAGNGGL